MKKRKSAGFYSGAFLIPSLAVYGVFFILPNLLNFFFAFTDWTSYNMNNIHLNGLDNFKMMVGEPILWRSILHTLYFTFATVILLNILGFLLALLMTQQLPLRNVYRAVFFIPTTLSVLVIAPVFSAIYNPANGPLNTFLRHIGLGVLAGGWITDEHLAMNSIVVMSVWASLGLTMMLYISGIQSVSRDCYESAVLDGCGFWKKTWYITLPMIMPAVTVNVVLSLVNGLKVFAPVYALTNGGPNDSTQVFGTLIFKNFGQGLLGYSAAISLVFTLIVSVFTFSLAAVMRKMEVEY